MAEPLKAMAASSIQAEASSPAESAEREAERFHKEICERREHARKALEHVQQQKKQAMESFERQIQALHRTLHLCEHGIDLPELDVEYDPSEAPREF